MKLGIVSYDFDPPIGGLGVIAKMYAQSLQSLDPAIECFVISPSPGTTLPIPAFVTSHWKKFGGCPLFSLYLLFSLPRLIQKFSLDVLHVHAGSGGVFVLRKPACPLIVTSHHTYRQEADLLFHRNPLKRLWKYLLSLLEKRTYQLADRVVCVSRDTAEVLKKRYSIPEEKILVIENPVDDVFFSESSLDDRKQGLILYVGRVEERKGVQILLEAFASVSHTFPSAKLTLVGRNLIGDELASELLRLRISDCVRCTGFLSQEDRIGEMRSAEVLVVPSILEGFGLVAAEAMALGTPVVASDCDGLRSIVSHGVTGTVSKVGSVDSLAQALSFALKNPHTMSEISRHAKEEATRRFSRSTQVKILHDLLISCLRRSETCS